MLSCDEPEIETACRGARSLGPETRSPRIRRPCVEHLLRGALEMKPPLDRPRAVLMAVPSGGGPNPNPTQDVLVDRPTATRNRSEEHTSELQSLMRISYAVFCLNN